MKVTVEIEIEYGGKERVVAALEYLKDTIRYLGMPDPACPECEHLGSGFIVRWWRDHAVKMVGGIEDIENKGEEK